MIPAGTWLVCPVCRVFCDRASTFMPELLEIPCPWCARSSLARDYVKCAEVESCTACGHPLTMHVQYGTPDGRVPEPGMRVLGVPCPCSAPIEPDGVLFVSPCGCERPQRAGESTQRVD